MFIYKLLKSSWGIWVRLHMDWAYLEHAPANSMRVDDKIFVTITAPFLLDAEKDYILFAISLVRDELIVQIPPHSILAIEMTRAEFNECDYQSNGLVSAILAWIEDTFQIETPQIPVSFNKEANRYVFVFPQKPPMNLVRTPDVSILKWDWQNHHDQYKSYWGQNHRVVMAKEKLFATRLCKTTKAFLRNVGLPCVANWAFVLAANHEMLSATKEAPAFRRLGSLFEKPICIHEETDVVYASEAPGFKRVNSSLIRFAYALVVCKVHQKRISFADELTAEAIIDTTEKELIALDPQIYADRQSYWPVLVRQMRETPRPNMAGT